MVEVVGDFLLGVDEDGETSVFLGALRPFVGVAHRRPVVGVVGAVAVASVGDGEHPVIEVVDTFQSTVVVAVGGGLVEVAVVLLLFQEVVAARGDAHGHGCEHEGCYDMMLVVHLVNPHFFVRTIH